MAEFLILVGILTVINLITEVLKSKPPLFLLTYNTNKLYTKVLLKIEDKLHIDKKILDSYDEEIHGDIKEDQKEIVKNDKSDLNEHKEIRNMVYELIQKYQDKNKSYKHILMIWKRYLDLIWELESIPNEIGVLDVMGNDEATEFFNNLRAYRNTIKEIYKYGDWRFK